MTSSPKLIITSPNWSLFKYVVITVDVLYVVDAETPILAPFFVISPKLALNSKFVANVLVVSDDSGVLWAVGVRRSECALIDDETRNVLDITIQ